MKIICIDNEQGLLNLILNKVYDVINIIKKYDNSIWYRITNNDNTNTKKIEIISIEIEYMDKTKVLIDKYGINDIIIDELN